MEAMLVRVKFKMIRKIVKNEAKKIDLSSMASFKRSIEFLFIMASEERLKKTLHLP